MMTPEQLVKATGLFYDYLVHPELQDSEFQNSLNIFRNLDKDFDRGLALELIQEVNWRDRLLGFAVAAVLRDWSLSRAIVDTYLHPTGISIVPVGAWLICHYRCSPETFPEIDFTKFNHAQFDGEIGWVIQHVQSEMEGRLSLTEADTGPYYGQPLLDHIELYETLVSIA